LLSWGERCGSLAGALARRLAAAEHQAATLCQELAQQQRAAQAERADAKLALSRLREERRGLHAARAADQEQLRALRQRLAACGCGAGGRAAGPGEAQQLHRAKRKSPDQVPPLRDTSTPALPLSWLGKR